MEPDIVNSSDVTVIGGGLSGMAASLHLAKAGFRVACIEPEAEIRQSVGESLDWSSPALLASLGLPMESLIQSGVANYKRGVTLQIQEGGSKKFRPSPWVAQAPFNITLDTIHVDRMRLDRELQSLAIRQGVSVVQDKALAVERTGRRVTAIRTASGRRFASRWFVDASGSFKSLLAREFALPASSYGRRKVCLWAHFAAQPANEGTTIYMDNVRGKYQDWIWEIPIGPNLLSVGYITTGEAVKRWRDQNLTIHDIFQLQLARFPRLASMSQDSDLTPRVTTFSCRVYQGIAGPNWIIVGEAASMVDPITSNGVTAALRHAEEASALITNYRTRAELPSVDRTSYGLRVLWMGAFFNSGIERLVYECPARDRMGLVRAATVYTAAAWSMNAIYSRFRPRGILSTLAFGTVLNMIRAGTWMYYRLSRFLAGSKH